MLSGLKRSWKQPQHLFHICEESSLIRAARGILQGAQDVQRSSTVGSSSQHSPSLLRIFIIYLSVKFQGVCPACGGCCPEQTRLHFLHWSHTQSSFSSASQSCHLLLSAAVCSSWKDFLVAMATPCQLPRAPIQPSSDWTSRGCELCPAQAWDLHLVWSSSSQNQAA